MRRATFGPRADEVDAAERAGYDATLANLLTPSTVDAGAARTPAPKFETDPLVALAKGADRATRQKAQQDLRQQVQQIVLWWLDRLVAADHQFAEKLVFFWHGHWATSVEKVRSAVVMLRQQQTFRDLGAGDFGPFLKAMLRDPALIIWLDGQQNTAKAPNENLARESMELFTLGIGNYTEADVRAAARALTGWQVRRGDLAATFASQRHDGGDKTILGRTGAFDTDGYADLLLAQPAHPKFLAARLWYRFASGEPLPDDVAGRLADAYRAHDVTALAKALFTDRGLKALGQTLFAPPSVGGWPAGAAWLSTSATEHRVAFATQLAARASRPVLDAVAAGGVEGLSRLLVVDGFTDRTRAVLGGAVKDPKRLLALGLASPEYAVC
ncbi:MAG: hypothetical protein AUI14_25950 [Actinobacteria bacterium 13_2_20CM_2_71_6]|nr:MAG: hypothetical protein AUI14_25950 [Actinobacteria bacterium 13_2_20CM_2_71_6]